MKKFFLLKILFISCVVFLSGCKEGKIEDLSQESGSGEEEIQAHSNVNKFIASNKEEKLKKEEYEANKNKTTNEISTKEEWATFFDSKTGLTFKYPKEFGVDIRDFINNKMTFSSAYGTFILIPKNSNTSIDTIMSSVCSQENIQTPFPDGSSTDSLIFCQEYNKQILQSGISRKIVRNGLGGIYSLGVYNYEFQTTYVLGFDDNEHYSGAILHMAWGESCLTKFNQYKNNVLVSPKGAHSEEQLRKLNRKQECEDVITDIAYQICSQEESNAKKINTFGKFVNTITLE